MGKRSSPLRWTVKILSLDNAYKPALLALLLFSSATMALAQGNYEIQVYRSETQAPGTTVVELHAHQNDPRAAVRQNEGVKLAQLCHTLLGQITHRYDARLATCRDHSYTLRYYSPWNQGIKQKIEGGKRNALGTETFAAAVASGKDRQGRIKIKRKRKNT